MMTLDPDGDVDKIGTVRKYGGDGCIPSAVSCSPYGAAWLRPDASSNNAARYTTAVTRHAGRHQSPQCRRCRNETSRAGPCCCPATRYDLTLKAHSSPACARKATEYSHVPPGVPDLVTTFWPSKHVGDA
jgi:hypothetical protein